MNDNIIQVSIEKELEDSYLSYAMSVIVSRAIPDVRDGLKPVHRRVLYSMYKSGYDYGKPYRKSARVVGDVMGKYHPHGDAAIYDSLVRMAQDFSLLVPLIDGQGNFGSIDGDPPASMRYTEARLTKAAHFLLNDIEEDTVDFQFNYDESEREPVVLPAEFPNILINGAGGVAVGMSTNIPPHNLGEVIDACIMYINDSNVTLENLLTVIKGPDFPTGGVILGFSGIHSAFKTGKGMIVMQGKTHIEDISGKQAIIIDEIPYQVNKAKLIERIHDLIKDKRIEGISDLRDESNRSGIRVVIELKKHVTSDVILNQIFGLTPLRSTFSINTLVLCDKKPKVMPLLEIIKVFVEYRKYVVVRRTEYRLRKVREKAHLYIGLYIAVINIDKVIAIIKSSSDSAEASRKLLACQWEALDEIKSIIELVADSKSLIKDNLCQLTNVQVKAILDMRLQRLTGLEKEKINSELRSMVEMIKGYIAFLQSPDLLSKLVKTELENVKSKLSVSRKTTIEEFECDIDVEDLIPKEEMVITVTMSGYIKRVKLSNYKTQKRGGKGRIAQAIKEEDITTKLFVLNTHTSVLFFSNIGRVYKLKVYKLPLGEPTSRGRALVNIFPLIDGEVITNVMPLPEQDGLEDLNILFATASGKLRRNALADFQYVPSNGKIAMVLEKGDRIVSVEVCKMTDNVLLSTKLGKSIRFPVGNVRQFKGRISDGVRAIKMLSNEDQVISMSILSSSDVLLETREIYLRIPVNLRINMKNRILNGDDISNIVENGEVDSIPELSAEDFSDMLRNEQFILTVTENGYGKRTSAYEYRTTARGGVGIINILTTPRNGNVVASFPVDDNDNIMLITDKGQLIRISADDIRIVGRSTQGVTLFKVDKNDRVVSVAKVADSEESTLSDSVVC